ncbi:hypothetical protein [Sporichthya polymorpha]|uniref:hypothetical protein n=1 Tax=Sporichthya polymorpha TaxID=35751 RepID=UPI0003A1CE80|nr:hypothetical protein [Sporichthya polymorpha]
MSTRNRAPRWALALTALGTLGAVGASAAVIALPGSASAEDTRYNLEARGDAFYFEVNGDEIPASPKNDAGSLTASAQTTNSGGSQGFAGMPYWGNTVQTLPGTANGIPNQFGAGQVQIPFAVLPGYVQTASNATQEASEDFGYGRIKSTSTDTASSASAAYGAPPNVPAPNQQQSANASTEAKGNSVTAVASGSSAGFVSGPLEVGNSTALASITQAVSGAPKIEAKTFGRFSVNGQDFGFDQNGFRYLGQGQDSKQAIAQANDVLKNAGIKLELAPVLTDKDETGKTTYTIGGLMVTTTQASPTGAGNFEITYILGRAKVGASFAKLGYAASAGTTSAGTSDSSAGSASGSGTNSTTDAAAVDTALPAVAGLPDDLAAQAAEVPSTLALVTDTGVQTLPGAAPVSGDVVRSLGFSVKPGQTGDGSEWLYAMLVLAGITVLGGHFMFTRLAAARNA